MRAELAPRTYASAIDQKSDDLLAIDDTISVQTERSFMYT